MFEKLFTYISESRKKFAESLNPPFNANNMLLLAEYDNIVNDDEKRLSIYKMKLKDFVESKARLHQKTCTYDIPSDLEHYTSEIITWLEGMGFSVLEEGKYHDDFKGSIGISWKRWSVNAEKSQKNVDEDATPFG